MQNNALMKHDEREVLDIWYSTYTNKVSLAQHWQKLQCIMYYERLFSCISHN